MAGIAGYAASHAVFTLFVGRLVVVRAVLVLLVWIHFALFTLLLSSGPRCSASWSVWNRRAVFTAIFRPRSSSTLAVVVPSVVDMLEMLGILFGTDQKTSYTVRLWPRSPSTWTVACAWLVLLV